MRLSRGLYSLTPRPAFSLIRSAPRVMSLWSADACHHVVELSDQEDADEDQTPT